jgi:hypothetical protein
VYRALQKMRDALAEGPHAAYPYDSDPGVRLRRFSRAVASPDIGAVRRDGAAVHRSA